MSSFTLLRVDASMKKTASTSRLLTERLVSKLTRNHEATIIHRDLADGVPFIDADWIDANFTEPEDRSESQKQALAISDSLVDEMRQADVMVLSVPIYNFGVPGAFKAWIDQIARARETFRYTDRGPVGMLSVKACYLIVSSGGTPVGSSSDYVTGYIRFLFRFLGIDNIEVIACDGLMTEGEAAEERAMESVDSLELPDFLRGRD